MRTSSPRLLRLLAALAVLAVAGSCGGEGCGCVQPIPGGFPLNQRYENGAQARVSQSGISYLEQHYNDLIKALLPGGIDFEIPSSCGSTSICCPQPSQHCRITGNLTKLDLTPNGTSLGLLLRAVIRTNTLPVGTDLPIIGDVECNASVDTTRSGANDLGLRGNITFAIEGSSRLTRMILTGAEVIDLAGADVVLSGAWYCDIADWGIIKDNFIMPEVMDSLNSQLADVFADQTCQRCGAGNPCPAGASCQSGVCMQGGKCVQLLGFEGRVDLASTLSDYNDADTLPLDFYARAGGYANTPQNGLSLGMMAGIRTASHSDCVPTRSAPAVKVLPISSVFSGNSKPAGGSFHVGIGIPATVLEAGGFAAFDNGTLCLHVDSSLSPQLTTAALGLLMPSLGELTHGETAAIELLTLPQQPPKVALGAGKTHLDSHGNVVIDEPLVTITLPQLAVDVYAFIDQRNLRIFTLTADVALPMAMEVNNQNQMTPVIGDLSNAISKLTVSNSELLAEDPNDLAKTFPTVLAALLPALSTAIPPIELPEFSGIRLKLGSGSLTAVQQNTILALFAELGVSGSPLRFHAETRAAIGAVRLPPAEAFRVGPDFDPTQPPAVELILDGDGFDGRADHLEYSLRVDGGFPTPFAPNPRPTLRSPLFFLRGRHLIEVTAREQGEPATADPTPARIEVVIEPEPEPTAAAGVTSHAPGQAAASSPPSPSVGAMLFLFPVALPVAAVVLRRRRPRLAAGPQWRSLPALLLVLAAMVLGLGLAACGGTVEVGGDGGAPLDGGEVLVDGAATADRALAIDSYRPLPDSRRPDASRPPPLKPGPVGRFSDLTGAVDGLLVSAYEENYGDLVVGRPCGEDPGICFEAIDGVPAVASPPNPGTYRDGITDRGDDVGFYTAIASDGQGGAHVACQDVTHKKLRYSRGSPGDPDRPGNWQSMTVEAGVAGGEPGLYNALILDKDGKPGIAFMVHAIPDGQGFRSELRFARAKLTTPSVPADFTTELVEKLKIPCTGLCASGKLCVASDDTCRSTSSGCGSGCTTGKACVSGACVTVRQTPTFVGLRAGVGLFARAARLPDGTLAIAYYDSVNARLRLAKRGASSWAPATLANDVNPRGAYLGLTAGSDGTLHLSYHAGGGLAYYKVKGSNTREVVDDGMRSDGQHPVGTDSAVVVDGAGKLHIVYQDSRTHDLLHATRGSSSWTHSTLRSGAPGYGFFPHLALLGSKAYFSTLVYDRQSPNLERLEIAELK